ncbi:RHS repeat-associated core domain-containing protein, partial [Faecalispora jeddahensis]|uniref:RHS repeat-associated core domain-containing protein n=1 Tax=Faecalispora jeddahensis TaxID=1414721 RepID=UPI00189A83DA
YYYLKNAQGDVTGIVDSNLNVVVEYSYDAWGKLIETTGSEADFIGKLNPFLYRGYYYDAETELYYLGNRYYDPVTGRFLNADSNISIGEDLTAANLYLYCGNNPVTRVDSDGLIWEKLASLGQAIWNIRENNLRAAEKIQIESAIKYANMYAAKFGKNNDFSWEMYFYAFLYGDSLAANYAYGISGGIKVQGWIQRSTMNQVGNRFGQKGRTAFGNALAKGIVGKEGSGIKRLAPGTKVAGKAYQYELKVKADYGDWRIYGNMNDKGQIIFELFEKALH